MPLTDAQFQKLLGVIQSLKATGIQWDQVLPVFLSAFLAMCVGIALETLKTRHEEKRARKQRQQRELEQINGVIVGIAYNIEVLLHITLQLLLPHHRQSGEAFKALQTSKSHKELLVPFLQQLSDRFPHATTSCPIPNFVQFDFLDRLTFLIERDADLVKQTAWMTHYTILLKTSVETRNTLITKGGDLIASQHGMLNIPQLEGTLLSIHSNSVAQCVNAFELFRKFIAIGETLQKINQTYKDCGKATKFQLPLALSQAMKWLEAIHTAVTSQMKDYEGEGIEPEKGVP